MKKLILTTLLVSLTLQATPLVQTPSKMNVDACTKTIVKEIESKKGFAIFSIIDHHQNAEKVGLTLAPQKVIVFGNPKAGTLLMQADAQIGYELPLRIMVRQEGTKTIVEYREPKTYTKEYALQKSSLPAKMSKLLSGLASSCK